MEQINPRYVTITYQTGNPNEIKPTTDPEPINDIDSFSIEISDESGSGFSEYDVTLMVIGLVIICALVYYIYSKF